MQDSTANYQDRGAEWKTKSSSSSRLTQGCLAYPNVPIGNTENQDNTNSRYPPNITNTVRNQRVPYSSDCHGSTEQFDQRYVLDSPTVNNNAGGYSTSTEPNNTFSQIDLTKHLSVETPNHLSVETQKRFTVPLEASSSPRIMKLSKHPTLEPFNSKIKVGTILDETGHAVKAGSDEEHPMFTDGPSFERKHLEVRTYIG